MLEVRIDFRDFYVSANKAVKTVSRVDEGRGGGGRGARGRTGEEKRDALLFSASYITLFIMPGRFYGEILR